MEQVVLEINPRTKEKIVKPLTECELNEGYLVKDLIEEHQQALVKINKLENIVSALINVVGNVNKSMNAQIVEIKEEIK